MSLGMMVALFLGCGGEASAPATLSLLLTDAPGQFQRVPVTIEGVQAHYEGDKVPDPKMYQDGEGTVAQTQEQQQNENALQQGGGAGEWLRVMAMEQQHDLLQLQDGKTAQLGEEQLPAGYYNQLRLQIKSMEVEVDGRVHGLDVPAEGVQLSHRFRLKAGEHYALTLDFDAGKSIEMAADGGYRLQADVTVKQFQHHSGD